MQKICIAQAMNKILSTHANTHTDTHMYLNMYVKKYIYNQSTQDSRIYNFSGAHEILTKILNDFLHHKTNPDTFKIIYIMQSMFSDYSGIKIKVSNIKTAGKFLKTFQLYNTVPNDPRIKCNVSNKI